MFPGQGGLQLLILFACFVSVPIMLFPKPIILKRRHEQKRRGRHAFVLNDTGDGTQQVNSSEELRSLGENSSYNNNSDDDHGHGDEEFDFGDVLVHQMIHTIEFVLARFPTRRVICVSGRFL